MVPLTYQCRPMFCHWQSLFTIGINGMPMVIIGCQWVLSLVINLSDNLEVGKITNAPNDVIFRTATRSEFSNCQWYQWQPMAASGTNGKITNGTIGKTPNARIGSLKLWLF